MQALIVEGRKRAVVAAVGALHVRVAGEEVGVAVDPSDPMVGLARGLAADHDLLRARPLGKLGRVGGDVDQQPVREVGAIGVLGDRLAVLVGVGGVGRNVGVVN